MLLDIIMTLLFGAIIGIIIINFCNDTGLNMPKNNVFKWITMRGNNYNGESVTKKDIYYIFGVAIAFRIIVYLISTFIIRIFMDPNSVFDGGTFFAYWERWDAQHYTKLASQGYMNYTEGGQHLFLVFFPLYPFLVCIMNVVIGSYDAAAMIVSTLAYSAGCCFLYKMVAEDYNKSIAKKAVIYLSVFPFAFFFGGVMTEGVFFLTTTACLYFIRKHKWATATLFGILATLSRMTGIILIVVALIEFCIYYKPIFLIKQKKYMELWRLVYKKAILIPFMSIGTMIYLYLNYEVEGDSFRFLFYQKNHWYQGSQYFTKTGSLIFTNAFNTRNESNLQAAIWLPAVLIFVMAAAIIIYGYVFIDKLFSYLADK